jgi:hypothetical protein
MFERYIVVEDTLRNVTRSGEVVGYELGVRLPYYRGLGLSMVEELDVHVDGTTAPRDTVAVCLHGHRYSLGELPTVFDDRWEMGEIATVQVVQPGGLAPGTHEVTVRLGLRISYMPVPGGGCGSASLELQPPASLDRYSSGL